MPKFSQICIFCSFRWVKFASFFYFILTQSLSSVFSFSQYEFARYGGIIIETVHVCRTQCLNPSLFQSSSLPRPHGFTTGLKLEAVNPNDPSSICAATVSKVASEYFFQVEIDSEITCVEGSRPSIWCSSNSRNIFPVGWCEKNNIQLTPPPGIVLFICLW